MTRQRDIILFLAFLSISVVHADIADRSRDQFRHFFPTFEAYWRQRFLNDTAEENCAQQFRNYHDPNKTDQEALTNPGDPLSHHWAMQVVECTLNMLDEINKSSMATSAILLALLPVGLVSLGPTMAELSFLSTRRPILAALLGFAAPSPNPSQELDWDDMIEKSKKVDWISGMLDRLSGSRKILASIVILILEYAIGIGATANCFYQMWKLTYRAVSLAPIFVYIYGIPEEATLFGWAFLNLPLHLVAFGVFAFAYGRSDPNTERARLNPFVRFIQNEFQPAVFGRPLYLEPRQSLRPRAWKNTFGALSRLGASLHITCGTVLLGSILYITLVDSLPLIYTFIAAAVLTKLVVVFELQGLRHAVAQVEAKRPRGTQHEGAENSDSQYHQELRDKSDPSRKPFLVQERP